ncbi:MAG: bifunctional oligoribonuclease/PAP phosphatase NrnA [Actinobacteria bacterium]|nr:bifunctional oligoribonuclease/PAP phosphatase NrnA [Actinomycetota bacterium]
MGVDDRRGSVVGGTVATPEEVAARLKDERKVLIAVHENPDGDALGSLSALGQVFDDLGCSWKGYVPGRAPLPSEYLFLPGLDRVARGELPPSPGTLYTLDCASVERFGPEGLQSRFCVNIDHHPDNPHFGDVNLVDPTASSTTQVLYDVFRAGGFPITKAIGTALYVGIVTDTGRFQYSNTTAAAHRMAADLQDMGVDVHDVYRRVYESTPVSKMMLKIRAFETMRFLLDGALAVAVLRVQDFEDTAAQESHTEGIIDGIRTVAGIRVAALFREKLVGGASEFRVSLRSTDGSVDVSEVAHIWGGGGHVRAAGYTIRADVEEAVAALKKEIETRL